ncbi:MAG: hypothetical protein AAGA12_11850 [Pseudomonadota bacterium]
MNRIALALCGVVLAGPSLAADARTYTGLWTGPGTDGVDTSLAFLADPVVTYCFQGQCFDFQAGNTQKPFGFESGGAVWEFVRTDANTIKGTYTTPKGAVYMSTYVAEN